MTVDAYKSCNMSGQEAYHVSNWLEAKLGLDWNKNVNY